MTTPPAIKDITKRNVELIAQMEAASESQRTFGERVADRAATLVGSWTFLIAQSVLLVIWMTLNAIGFWRPWDAYPFVLLNLVLSFQAAFATPVLLMSQNRQGRMNERRNQLDLQINLLTEQENTEQLRLLRLLCEKAGIYVDDAVTTALEEATQPGEIIRQIEATGDAGERAESSPAAE